MTVVALRSAEKKMFVYMVPPIDFWEGWTPEEEFLAGYARCQSYDVDWLVMRMQEYAFFRKGALALAKRMGWEGDMKSGPYVTAVPNGDCESDFMIAWKQCSNGDTFIVSPFLLPWLEEFRMTLRQPRAPVAPAG